MLTLCSHFATCYLCDRAFTLHWIKAFFLPRKLKETLFSCCYSTSWDLWREMKCLFLHVFVCVHTHIQAHAPYRMGLVNWCSIGLQEGSTVPTELCVRVWLTAIFICRLWYLMYKPVVVYLTTRWKNCFTYDATSACLKYRKLCWQVLLSLLLVIWHQWDHWGPELHMLSVP